MEEHEASRTLVKSAPELWMACSEEASLARHLSAFGEIRITRLEPESTVAWEGDAARGTVRIEPSGWGTRVTLTVGPPPGTAVEPPHVEPAEPPTPTGPDRVGLWQRLFARRRREPVRDAPEPTLDPHVALSAELEAGEDGPSAAEQQVAEVDAAAALDAALDSLGQAHHRPFSRS